MICMSLSGCRSVAAAGLCLLVLTSCKDSVAPDERVTAVEVVAGNEQEAAVATTLPQPLAVRAVDSEGRAVRGATIAWEVTAGSGTITPVAETTDAEGRATASWTLGPGAGEQTATVRVRTVTATLRATARPGPAATLTVSPTSATLDAIGATAQFQVAARDAHDNVIVGAAPQWTVTTAGIVSVSQAGLATALAPGSTRVRATLDAASAEADVAVQPVPASVVVEPAAHVFTTAGATVQLQAAARDRNGNAVAVPAQDFAWSSSNPLAVSVSMTGLATAVASGTAQVRATLNAIIGFSQVTVQQTAVSVVVAPRTDTLTTARPTVALTVTARDASDQPILAPALTWTSSNTGIATVSAAGLVTAVSNGVARIRVASGTARDSATIVVRLNAAPRAVVDNFGAERNTAMTVALPGVLANDTLGVPPGVVASFGGGSLGGVVTANAAGSTATFGTGGSLRINADGSVEFTPTLGFLGTWSVLYRVQNAIGFSDATLFIEVGAAPTLVDDAYATTAGVPIAIVAPGLLANDDVGSPVGVITSFGGPTVGGSVTAFAAGQTVGFGIGGFLLVNADGSMSFTPPTGFTGTFTFQYRVTNPAGSRDATVTITVT